MAKLTAEEKSAIMELVDRKLINITHHPTLPLVIYNYSKFAMYEEKFNDILEKCRGLICDEQDNIIARPFEKFYNYEELPDTSVIPHLPFEIYDKLDGSLGILYWWDGTAYMATRGSFSSDQAMHANTLLRTRYSERINRLDHTKTYLFEIIYPGDLHVVSYNGMDELVLLAIIDTETGEEEDIYSLEDKFILPRRYDGISNWLQIRELVPGDNREGFVIKFQNNFRLKLKYAEYFELHSLMYGLSEKVVLEHIVNGTIGDISDTIAKFEEEQQIFFNNIIKKYNDIHDDILNEVRAVYRDDFPTKKDAAAYILKQKYSGIMFTMYDGKDYEKAIWTYIWKHRLEYKGRDLEDDGE